jgi:hypothetical protein
MNREETRTTRRCPLTREELLGLSVTTDLPTLGRAFGISEPTARERQRRGEWERMGIRVVRLGQKQRVITADILRVLGITSGSVTDHGITDGEPTAPRRD